MGFLKVLRLRHLAILWLSQVLSAVGDRFYAIAVIWIAVKIAGSAAGIVVAAEAGSMLLFGLPGGVYADRWNRRTTMITVDLLRAVAVACLPILAEVGMLRLWHLAVVAIVVGGLGALFDPALQGSLPALTSDIQTLQATNGLMDVTRRLARVLGPSLAGLLITLLPLFHFFTLDAISFAISAAALFSLGKRFAWKPARTRRVPIYRARDTVSSNGVRGMLGEIAGALRLVRSHSPLLWALVSNGLISVVWAIAFTIGAALLADRVLGGNVGAYGLIVGAYGVGNVLSNLVIGSLTIRRRVALIFTGKLVLGAGFLILAAAPTLPVALVGSAFAATGGPMNDIMTLTMIQTDLPADQVGKVYSLRTILENLGLLLGLLLAVPLFAYLSIPLVIALCALVMIAIGAASLLRFGFSEPVINAAQPEQS
jgi:MFS transporter, DHA3 family, macrolide efflux protein